MLFEVKKYEPSQPVATGDAAVVDESTAVAAPSAKLQDVINLLDHGRSIAWLSNGDWSMHQLLEQLLEKTGPAEVWISSYAFSETPARVISDLKRTGYILWLHCLIDSRVDVRSASALAMMRNVCNRLKLCHTHAKVTVIKNHKWFLVVTGSSNYTTNKRYEAGFISCNSAIASFHQKWIDNELTC